MTRETKMSFKSKLNLVPSPKYDPILHSPNWFELDQWISERLIELQYEHTQRERKLTRKYNNLPTT